MKNTDLGFVILGFSVGVTLGTAIIIAVLPEPAQYGGAFVTASATLFGVTIAALMVKYQLRENYRNQVKLEKLKYLGIQKNRENLAVLRVRLAGVAMWLTNQEEQVDEEWLNQTMELLEYLAPINGRGFYEISGLVHNCSNFVESDNFNKIVDVDYCHAAIQKTVEDLDDLLTGNPDAFFLNSE